MNLGNIDIVLQPQGTSMEACNGVQGVYDIICKVAYCEDRGAVAKALTDAIVDGYEGIPACHGMDHINAVARNALSAMTRDYTHIEQLVLVLSALAHDISDGKFAGYVERWNKFVAVLEQVFAANGWSEYVSWVVFVVNHVGVSKEAGSDYMIVRSQEAWIRLAKDVSRLRHDVLLDIRHTVSSADIIEALGAYGHERVRVHSHRLFIEQGMIEGTPEYITAMFKNVTRVHKMRTAKLCRWIHNDILLKEAIRRWQPMVEAYEDWARLYNFEPSLLTASTTATV
jgi:hypothetical protein